MQQLVARIKKSSKYHYQAPPAQWFDVRIESDRLSYSIIGNNNQYRAIDLAFGVRIDTDKIVELNPVFNGIPKRRRGTCLPENDAETA
jgi:hypothetical protein